MKTTTRAFLFSLMLIMLPSFASAMRAMTEAERTQLKTQLNTVLENNQDECYVNISNMNSIEVLSQSPQKKKSYVEKKTRDSYVSGRLSSTLNMDATDVMLPEGAISEDSTTSFSIAYTRPVDLNVVEFNYEDILSHNIVEGLVVHYFDIENGQAKWKYSTLDLQDGDTKKAHVRCKSKGDSGFEAAKAAAKPTKAGSFIFLDLELLAPEKYCLMQCTEPMASRFSESTY
ncbi:MAG: hypothetical protein B7Y39_09385 [Bdellovibrio sp. 28-41-41]|nr:MAG: hypothetical protein B7Y39_09385 [Bdellovibrio sp. 28-41-41]